MRRGLALSVAVLLPIAVVLGDVSGDERSPRRTPVVLAVERVAPATVNIMTRRTVHTRVGPFFRSDPFFDRFFGRFLDPRSRSVQSLGTGVIIEDRGLVLTNEHVLAGASEIRVTLSDGREFDAELIGADRATDLAIVELRTDEKLPVAPLGSSEDLWIGETVIAIGNPFGLNHTVTTGVLSATNRSIQTQSREYHGFLQTDASINPGNSGGPLLNIEGNVIGVTTAILGEAEGIGFAIPIDRALRIVDDLIRHGEVVPVWLGLRVQDLTPALREAFRVDPEGGAVVSYVFPHSEAQKRGIERGDIVRELDGSRVDSTRAYFEILAGLTEGDTTTIRIERGGAVRDLEIAAELFPEERANELARVLLGLGVRESAQGPGAGLVVTDIVTGSPADRAGIRPGDRVLKVGRDLVDDTVAFRKAMTKLRGQRFVVLVIQRGRAGYYVTLEVS